MAAVLKCASRIGLLRISRSSPYQTAPAAAPVLTEAQKAEARENEILAQRRENEKKREEYWRGRSRALLTQMRVEEEQIAIIQAQIEDSRRIPQSPPSTVSVYNQPNY